MKQKPDANLNQEPASRPGGFRINKVRLVQLIKNLEKRNRELVALANQILRVQEEERKKISRELHDEVGQALAAVSIALATVKSHGTDDAKIFNVKLGDAQRLLSGTMETVHKCAGELRPTLLDELGLLPALRSLVKSFQTRTGLQVRFHGDAAAEKLSGAQKTVLFRVAQESLNNAARQVNARHVEVAIRNRRMGICMTISDDGSPLESGAEKAGRVSQPLVLLGMQAHVRMINGQFRISARRKTGTLIRVLITPLDNLDGA